MNFLEQFIRDASVIIHINKGASLLLSTFNLMSSIISASQIQINQLKSLILSLGSDSFNVFRNTLLRSVKRSKFKYLGAAIALYVVSRVYRMFTYPRKLGHLKRIPPYLTIKSFLSGENDLQRAKKFVLPHWRETNGIICLFGQFGWIVVVSNPEAVRTVLYKTGMGRSYVRC